MDRIKNTLKYIALSYKINFTGGARLLVWMVLLILPSVLEIINSRVYSGLIDSFAGLTAGTAVTSCFLWLTLVIAVRGAYSLLTKNKIYRLRPVRQRVRPENVALYRKARLRARTDKL